MYSFNTKVRYSELNKDGIVSPWAIVNYLQDCTLFHSDSLGADADFFKKENKVWVLGSWQIEIFRDILPGEELKICTWPYDFKGAYGYRNFAIMDKEGNYLVKAATIWVFTDLTKGRPVRLTEEYTRFYPIEEKLDMEYMDRKIRIAPDIQGEKKAPVEVRKHFIDINGHVNNGKYIECGGEYIEDGMSVRRIRAEYKKQARYGDVLYPVVYKMVTGYNDETVSVQLQNEEGDTYAVTEFTCYRAN